MKSVKIFIILFLFLVSLQTTARAAWTKQNSNTLAWLYDVYFLGERNGWIAGSGGAFLKTDDGGKTWTKQKNFTSDAIRQVYFTDERNGWLLCERNLYALGANSPSYLLKTDDGGASWQRVEFADSQRKRVTKIFFAKSGAGFAIGENGAFFSMTGDDEKIWQRQPSPVRYLMFDGIFTDDAHGVIVGAGSSIFFTDDGGASWLKASVSGSANTKLNSVFFINQRNGWAVGTEGKVYQTVNGGKVWREQNTNLKKDLTDIFFTNTADGWAVGDEGTILRTATAGNIWTTVNSKDKHRLEKILFVGKKGFAVGFGGTILSYDESGAGVNSAHLSPKFRLRN